MRYSRNSVTFCKFNSFSKMNEWRPEREARLNGAGGVWPLRSPLQHRLPSIDCSVASAKTRTNGRRFHHTPVAPFERGGAFRRPFDRNLRLGPAKS